MNNSYGLLNQDDILELIAVGVVEHALPEHVNPASLDITMGKEVLLERQTYVLPHYHRGSDLTFPIIDYCRREELNTERIILNSDGIVLAPNEFVLMQSEQVFHFPLNLSADYKLKSSMARIGLEHLKAGWCDPGWHGSVLTLEMKNLSQYHCIRLRPGDRIGQLVFFRGRPVQEGYKGRYNNDTTVRGIKP